MAQSLVQQASRALLIVEHPQADVDLGRASSSAVLAHRQPLGQSTNVVLSQSGVEESKPDRRSVFRQPRRCAGHGYGPNCLLEAIHSVESRVLLHGPPVARKLIATTSARV